MKVNIYIGFWPLKVKHTQFEICGEVVFKNARAMVFLKSDRAGRSFRLGPENHDFFVRQLPMPVSTSPKRLDILALEIKLPLFSHLIVMLVSPCRHPFRVQDA